MRKHIEQVMDGYLEARYGRRFSTRDPLTLTLRDLASEIADALGADGSRGLRTRYSAGRFDRWAAIPWLAIMDLRETHTAQDGLYVTLMWREDMEGLIAALVYGTQSTRREHGAQATAGIKARAERLRDQVDEVGTLDKGPVDLAASGRLGRDYEISTVVSRAWSRAELPEDDVLVATLEELMVHYRALIAAQPPR